MNRLYLQAWLMRVAGVVEILAFLAVVMPRSWMEASHTGLGLGEMPVAPVLMFMIRQASYTYGAHGISLLVIASNVERFRPLIILNGIAFLIGGPVFFLIDYTSGMPWWWTIADPLSCLTFGAALLWLSRKKETE